MSQCRSRRCPRPGQKLEKIAPSRGQLVRRKEDNKEKDFSKMNEQSGNLYENKGWVFHRWRQSGNVIENKDGYALQAGILLKTQHVRFLPTKSVQVGADIFAVSPSSTFDSRPSTVSGGKRGGRAMGGAGGTVASLVSAG